MFLISMLCLSGCWRAVGLWINVYGSEYVLTVVYEKVCQKVCEG
jgi:hypothetical protein